MDSQVPQSPLLTKPKSPTDDEESDEQDFLLNKDNDMEINLMPQARTYSNDEIVQKANSRKRKISFDQEDFDQNIPISNHKDFQDIYSIDHLDHLSV